MANIEISLPDVSIPPKSLEFFQRILGPFAEAGDFLSEKIRFYRWQSSLRTIERARQICEESGVSPKEIPLKTLVPLIEKSSLEEEGSPLTELWANLLAQASLNESSVPPIYLDILASLRSDDVVLLDGFIDDKDFEDDFKKESLEQSIRSINITIAAIYGSKKKIHSKFVNKYCDEGSFTFEDGTFNSLPLLNLFQFPSTMPLESVLITDKVEDNSVAWIHTNEIVNLESVDVLIRNGLISRNTWYYNYLNFEVCLTYLSPSVLGVLFVRACRGQIQKKTESQT